MTQTFLPFVGLDFDVLHREGGLITDVRLKSAYMVGKSKNKVVLDLCGGTGSWSEPYARAGYDVKLITLPKYDVREFQVHHFLDRPPTLYFQDQTGNDHIEVPLGDVHGILAAPPCTMFSRARNGAKTPRDFEGAMEIVSACLRIVWTCRSKGRLAWWALENPMGMLRQFLGNPSHSFRGWEYGDKHVKFTDLWGYFKMPTKTAKNKPAWNYSGWASPKKPAKYAQLKLSRADIRAITPPGFARAFCKANP